jgi:hypothetical protein
MAAQESTPDLNQDLMEVMALKRRAAELKGRHERLVESVASFPNSVTERRERELATHRGTVEDRIAALEQHLAAHGLEP